jgi:hypothetical protein
MTTRRAILSIVAVIGALLLLVVIFVAGLFGIASYQVSNSDAAARAKDFLRSNEKLKSDIGSIKSFGSLVDGSINVVTNEASLKLKVEGERTTVTASVNLVFLYGNTWRVSSASYVNSAGKTVSLLDPYDSKGSFPLLSV